MSRSDGLGNFGDIDGAVVGMALCGAFPIDDLDEAFDTCSVCPERLD